ncbi:hypothetical protein BDV30DRAFT_203280 [Aspergillus minisclerotigenes]|uniref:Uncharacterized protein n=1 Tax=Aspergillus minisclerotigenes TaxID=656917 RepID=A0A5N6JLI0_9EURO|nr:hypothetical protein BDV30DRAFT_203280 [Aspergillus minisclerotigenes]
MPIPIPKTTIIPLLLRQPKRLLHNQQIPLNQLRPILHVPDLLQPVPRLVRHLSQLIILLSELLRRPPHIGLLFVEHGRVVVEGAGSIAERGFVVCTDGAEGGLEGGFGFGGALVGYFCFRCGCLGCRCGGGGCGWWWW